MQQAREEFDKVKEANMESKIRFEIKDGEIVRLEEEALNLMKTSPSSETAKLREEVLSIREARQSRAQDGEQNHWKYIDDENQPAAQVQLKHSHWSLSTYQFNY